MSEETTSPDDNGTTGPAEPEEHDDPFSRAMRALGGDEDGPDDVEEAEAAEEPTEAPEAAEEQPEEEGRQSERWAQIRKAEQQLRREREQLKAEQEKYQAELERQRQEMDQSIAQRREQIQALDLLAKGDYAALDKLGINYRKWTAHALSNPQRTAEEQGRTPAEVAQIKAELEELKKGIQERESLMQQRERLSAMANDVRQVVTDEERFALLRSEPQWETHVANYITQQAEAEGIEQPDVDFALKCADFLEDYLVRNGDPENPKVRAKLMRRLGIQGATEGEQPSASEQAKPSKQPGPAKGNGAPARTLSASQASEVARKGVPKGDSPESRYEAALAVLEGRTGTG